MGEMMARCSPMRALSKVDLPTLGRPARTTVPHLVIAGKYTLKWKQGAGSGERFQTAQHEVRLAPGVPLPAPGKTKPAPENGAGLE